MGVSQGQKRKKRSEIKVGDIIVESVAAVTNIT